VAFNAHFGAGFDFIGNVNVTGRIVPNKDDGEGWGYAAFLKGENLCLNIGPNGGGNGPAINNTRGHESSLKENGNNNAFEKIDRKNNDDGGDIDSGYGGDKPAQGGIDGGGDAIDKAHEIRGLRVSDIDNLKHDEPAQHNLNDDNPEADIEDQKQKLAEDFHENTLL
jgi:hypothetical protein